MWCACVYLVDRAYGGPEEGGWYYDTGEPQPEMGDNLDAQFFASRSEAQRHVDCYKYDVHKLNQGRAPVSSVNSEGIYEWRITFGMPQSYPQERPHYE